MLVPKVNTFQRSHYTHMPVIRLVFPGPSESEGGHRTLKPAHDAEPGGSGMIVVFKNMGDYSLLPPLPDFLFDVPIKVGGAHMNMHQLM